MPNYQKLIINFEEFEALMNEYQTIVDKIEAFKFKFSTDKEVPIALAVSQSHFVKDASETPS